MYYIYVFHCVIYFFFFKQKTAYEMRISDWSSDVCSSDLPAINGGPTTGQQNADYVAGSQALEIRQGGTLRDRDSLLGDIANSSPMYVQDNEMIYVGANDGMLHAFSATKGQERFAYVPARIDFAALGTLSDPKYSTKHRYFVAGPVMVTSQEQAAGKHKMG